MLGQVLSAIVLLAAVALGVGPSSEVAQQPTNTPFDPKAVVEQISRKPLQLNDRIVVNGQRFKVAFDERGVILSSRRHGQRQNDLVIPVTGRPQLDGSRVTYQTEYGRLTFEVSDKGIRFEQRGPNRWVPTFSGAGARLRLDDRGRGSPQPLSGEFIINDDATLCEPCEESYAPAVASNGTDYFVAWLGYPDEGCIYGARVAADGTVLDPAGIRVSSGEDVFIEDEMQVPAVAFDGTNYLVVWSGYVEDPEGLNIYGARVTTGGVVLDQGTSRLNICVQEDNECMFVGACGGSSGSLVVWLGGEPDRGLVGTRVSPAGTVLDPAGIVVNEERPSDETRPAIAFDGANWLVAWTSEDLFCARVSQASGTVLDPTPIAVTTTGNCHSAGAAFGGGKFAVAWTGLEPGGVRVAKAARVSTSGIVADPDGTQVSPGDMDAEGACIAFDGSNFLVCWAQWDEFYSLYGARVSPATGVVLDPATQCMALEDREGEMPPALARGSGHCLLVCDGYNEDFMGVFAVRVAPPVLALDDPPIFFTCLVPVSDREAQVAFDGTNYLVVWSGSRGLTGRDIWAARVAPDGTVLDPDGVAVCEGAGRDEYPRVIYDPSGAKWLVAWRSQRTGSWGFDVRAARITGAGTVLDPDGFLVSSPTTTTYPDGLTLTTNGTDALAAWYQWDGAWCARISSAGTVLDPDGIALPTAGGMYTSYIQSAVSDGSDYFVTWWSAPPIGMTIAGARIGADGTLLDPAGVTIGTGPADVGIRSGTACYDPLSGFYVVSWQRNDWFWDSTWVFVARVNPFDGGVLDPGGILIDKWQGAYSNALSSVTSGTGSVLITWYSLVDGSAAIRAARFDAAVGTVLDPGGAVAGTPAFGSNQLATVFDGTNWLLLWQDWSEGVAGAHVSPLGAVLDGFLATVGWMGFGVTSGPADEALLVYPSYTASIGTYRTWGRVIDMGFVDVATEAVLAPAGSLPASTPVAPQARFRNDGLNPASVFARFSVRSAAGALVYEGSRTFTIPGSSTVEQEFAAWPFPHFIGSYTARCTAYVTGDAVPTNNAAIGTFTVTLPPGQPGWHAIDSMPGATKVKDGGALAADPNSGLIFEVKGNKTREFYCFNPAAGTWGTLRLVPPGEGSRGVGKGAAMTAGNGYVYVMKGNNTYEFYKYHISDSTWNSSVRPVPFAPDPAATRGKAAKGGGALAYVSRNDSDYVYLLKGGATEFYRYNVGANTFTPMSAALYNTRPKYDKGSWIVYDGTRYIYAMQAKYNALFRYDVLAEQWQTTPVLPVMPFNSERTGTTNKKVGDGGSATWDGTSIRTFKGGGTQEYWQYVPNAGIGAWAESESIPQSANTGGGKKKVKSGGAIAFSGLTGLCYAQKGNKCSQFWSWRPVGLYAPAPARDGVTASSFDIRHPSFVIAPNPLTGSSVLRLTTGPLDRWTTLSVYDPLGRRIRTFDIRASSSDIDLGSLPAGVYLVKLTSGSATATRKLVIER